MNRKSKEHEEAAQKLWDELYLIWEPAKTVCGDLGDYFEDRVNEILTALYKDEDPENHLENRTQVALEQMHILQLHIPVEGGKDTEGMFDEQADEAIEAEARKLYAQRRAEGYHPVTVWVKGDTFPPFGPTRPRTDGLTSQNNREGETPDAPWDVQPPETEAP
jgi:hypothetical protein